MMAFSRLSAADPRGLEPEEALSLSEDSRGPERGQALVEFALIAPLQLLFILFILQAAHVLVAKQVIAYASHAAARAVLVGRDPHRAASLICSGISPVSQGDRLKIPGWGDMPRSAAAKDRTRVQVLKDPGRDRGPLQVSVDYDLHLIIPVVNVFFSDETKRGDFTLRLHSESVTFKHWSELPEEGRGHPWIPDLPMGNDPGNPPLSGGPLASSGQNSGYSPFLIEDDEP